MNIYFFKIIDLFKRILCCCMYLDDERGIEVCVVGRGGAQSHTGARISSTDCRGLYAYDHTGTERATFLSERNNRHR